MARVKNALRRSHALTEKTPAPPITVGDLTIDPANRQVLVKEKPINLTPTEYRLLSHLARNAGRVLTHKNLLETVWGTGYDDATVLKTCIYQLRHKLIQAKAHPEMISSERGVGYRFTAT